MPTIKVAINGEKIKVKVSSRKAKNIKIECPPDLVEDTTMLFKDPEKLVLTEQNVAYLSGLCETHKKVLNLKPIFLKRISNLQSEIDSILKTEKGAKSERKKSDEGVKTSTTKAPTLSSSSNDGVVKIVKLMDDEADVILKSDEVVAVIETNTPEPNEEVEVIIDEEPVSQEPTEELVFSDEVINETMTEEIVFSDKLIKVKDPNEDIFSILEDADKMFTQELESLYNDKSSSRTTTKTTSSGTTKTTTTTTEITTTYVTNRSSSVDVDNRSFSMSTDVNLNEILDNKVTTKPTDGNLNEATIIEDDFKASEQIELLESLIKGPEESAPAIDENKVFKRMHSSKTIVLGRKSISSSSSTPEENTNSTMVTRENKKVSVSEDNKTTRVRATREREVVATKTTCERDPNLFVRIVSPKQKVITRYSSYSPEVNLSPVFGDFGGDEGMDLMLS